MGAIRVTFWGALAMALTAGVGALFGTVEQANEEDAVVKWDDDGRMRLHQPSLKKI